MTERKTAAPQRRKLRFLHNRWQALSFGVGASIISLLLYWYAPPLLENLDARSRDIVFMAKTPPEPPPEVVVVAVDEPSIKGFGRWPWPRGTQAQLIQSLKDMGAGTIALDIVYAQAGNDDCKCGDQDQILIDAIASPGAPVVGGYFFREHFSGDLDEVAVGLMHDNRIKRKLMAPGAVTNTIPVYEFVEAARTEYAINMAGLGAFNGAEDLDGLFRSVPLLLGYGDELYPSLSLRALAVYFEMGEGVTFGPDGVSEVKLNTFSIPVDRQGRISLTFYKKGAIPIYSAADILNGTLDPGPIQGRLVFVGVTEIGIGDLLPTPADTLFPGVAMHATVAANVINSDYQYDNLDTMLINVALIALIPLFGVLVMSSQRKLIHMLISGVLIIGLLWWGFSYMVTTMSHKVSILYPAGALLLAFAAFQIYYILVSQRTTRFLTGAFSSFVSPDVVQALISQPDSLGLSGERREITLLFSDIRGFTTIAEKLTPERLVEMLNKYFDAMTETILVRRGTLDKYIGDAVMAFFNAPVEIENHQHQAARSALAMIDKLNEMQDELKSEFDVEIKIGIGLHCGEAVVGNMGSTERFDYTAMGDTVNLAARAESITKMYAVEIIITGALEEHLEDSFVRRPIDKIQVKGKTVPADIFQLMTTNDENRALAERFATIYDHYSNAEFKKAQSGFNSILDDYPGDGPSKVLLERCELFLQEPPGEDWDGVFTATHK